eukprot:362201-Chlamydomonas_euryale.AAC.1
MGGWMKSCQSYKTQSIASEGDTLQLSTESEPAEPKWRFCRLADMLAMATMLGTGAWAGSVTALRHGSIVVVSIRTRLAMVMYVHALLRTTAAGYMACENSYSRHTSRQLNAACSWLQDETCSPASSAFVTDVHPVETYQLLNGPFEIRAKFATVSTDPPILSPLPQGVVKNAAAAAYLQPCLCHQWPARRATIAADRRYDMARASTTLPASRTRRTTSERSSETPT